MRIWIPVGITLALAAATPLAAQQPNFGLGVTLGVPTGALNSSSYPDGSQETYDSGVGGQFTLSWPLDRSLAMRLNVSGISFYGTGRAPGFFDWNLRESMFSVGGEAQVFMADGNASRHVGTYLLGGLHADFERFSASDSDPRSFAATSISKTRLGGTAGIGHTFRSYGRSRWSMEAAYHKTLTGTDSNTDAGVGFPAADFVKFYVGFAF